MIRQVKMSLTGPLCDVVQAVQSGTARGGGDFAHEYFSRLEK